MITKYYSWNKNENNLKFSDIKGKNPISFKKVRLLNEYITENVISGVNIENVNFLLKGNSVSTKGVLLLPCTNLKLIRGCFFFVKCCD